RTVLVLEPATLPLPPLVRVAAGLQHRYPAGAMDKQTAQQSVLAVSDFVRRSDWHVAGAVRHRGSQPASRFPEFFMGHVLPDALGLDDVHRNYWHVPGVDVPVPAHPARNFDF